MDNLRDKIHLIPFEKKKLKMKLFNEVYKGRRVLVTGHGFKGSWLTLWLLQLGVSIF